jgi:DNA topoisomerase I
MATTAKKKGQRAKKLVIVESPTKARTVGKFLGSSYVVRPSVGHIRDLPANRLGVEIESDFRPRYVIPEKKKEVVKALRADARAASDIYLATDPDREGEAISWHVVEALNLKEGKRVHRVEFHEITKDAIRDAFLHPRQINGSLVDAQQARRILDRLVGYKISPLLRRKITKKGLSAGRVQSVATRLIVDREREIEQFEEVEYWTIEADLRKLEERRGRRLIDFRATLHQLRGERADLPRGEPAERVAAELVGASYTVDEVRRRELTRNPAAPFTTSTLQQEASRKLGFTARRTMAVAQQLYEGVQLGSEGSVGLITYMRTDSVNLASSAVEQIRAYIAKSYGAELVPPEARLYRTRARNVQEAHEAVRPTSVERHPDGMKGHMTADQLRLYRLIWQRTVACQMASAVLDTTSVDIQADRAGQPAGSTPAEFVFRATGAVVKFQGFMAVYVEGHDEGDALEEGEGPEGRRALPDLTEGERLNLLRLTPEQHFTQPPPRYTEATLVKALEEYGIGRPSTYAPILSTIQERGYVERADKRLVPTELGKLVNDLLVEHFPEIVDVNFTSEMEEKLDSIAQADGVAPSTPPKPRWVEVLWDFYHPFEKTLAKADREMEQVELAPEPTDEICERCGRPMVIKYGRFGKFIACTGYPECRNAKSLMTKIDVLCPRCGGEIVEKRTRRKRLFYSCANWKGGDDPSSCTFAEWNRPAPCPVCRTAMLPAGKDDAACPKCHPELIRATAASSEPAPALSA